MIDLKQINVPVFLVYAGIIHAIGLALLMPMLVTLPGPGRAIAPKFSSVDIELAPAEGELTSALPAAPQAAEDGAAIEADPQAAAPADVAKVSPEGEPPAKDKAKAGNAKSAKPVKKPVAQRSKPVKPAAHRSAKKDPKIAPFNGALSGLFTPGAPAKRN